MITICLDGRKLELQTVGPESFSLLKEAIWIDLLLPTRDEEALVERALDLDIPTRDEMRDIELSSRLYSENDTLFMTASMIAQSDSADPTLDPVTFVLTPHQLISIRYIDPQAIRLFTLQLPKLDPGHRHAVALLIKLLEATVDRVSDILERIGRSLDDYSKTIFRSQIINPSVKLDYQQLMLQVGANGDLNTKARESLVSFNRLIMFLTQSAGSRIDKECQERLLTVGKDIHALSDHANFISSKVNFLLDATLGMVNIEQNNIIKIFSVAAVIFLPPTLIASIYGMNFHHMPELDWRWGYAVAIGLMLFSSWLPYRYFRKKKWL